MARLSDEVINQIKREVSLVRLIQSQGHQLKKHGKDYLLSCPFHDDKTASLVITPSTNLWHCMGACQKGGSVIDWVMQTQGVSFRFACEILQKDLGLIIDSGTKPTKQNTTTKLTPPLAANADNQTALRQVIDYYHETFKQSPEVYEYLNSRGLNNPELIERFTLGFANRTLGYRLPEKNRKAGAELRGKLQDIGILRSSGHEHFNGSLVVPIMDEHGIISEVYGRKILGNQLRKGTAQHLYLPGPHDGVWNIEALKASKEIIVCEALIDAMTFWVNGFRHVTSSYGTSGFTDSHLAAFKKYGVERVLIAYDRDDAGNNAANQLAEKLQAEGIECFRILLPKGMDVNEYALNTTPAVKALGLVIRKAEWMGKGKTQVQPTTETSPHPPLAAQAAKEKSIAPEDIAPLEPTAETIIESIPEPTTATPMPPLPGVEIEAEVGEHEIKIPLGQRLYRVRGLTKNMSYEHLKINLLVSQGEAVHVDQLELYNAKARVSFSKQAALELGVQDEVIKKDLGKVLLKLEALQDEQIKQTLAQQTEKTVKLSDEEHERALELLSDPDLLDRVLEDFTRCGVVGEETNKLVGYLACVSRKLEKPLAVIIQSSSAAGKSSLMDAVLNLMPEEERIQFSAMTGQSLFYMGEKNLKHKILAIAEEEGAEQASYALKLLQSEGEVSIASTGKNETTGNLETKSYTVEGPIMLFLTTTAIDIDEELMNRCMVLTVNESREQTEAIHALQRKSQTLEGLLQREAKKQVIQLHRNAQRLLRPLNVVNPYAEQLTFLADKTRTRRDHMKYLQLINSITLLHQHQRKIHRLNCQGETIDYIEVTLSDIKHANRLAHDVLGRSLDELPPQTRKLLQLIHDMVKNSCGQEKIAQKDYRFSRKMIREYSGWSDNQLKVHCSRLEELEYVLVHRGGRGNSIVYELLFDGKSGLQEKQMMGLLNPKHLKKQGYDDQKLGSKNEKLDSSCPQVGLALGQGCTTEKQENPTITDSHAKPARKAAQSTVPVNKSQGASYRSHSVNTLVAQGIS